LEGAEKHYSSRQSNVTASCPQATQNPPHGQKEYEDDQFVCASGRKERYLGG